MKNKDRSSSCCNNCHQQSSKSFCNFCKCFGHNIETCYHRNKSVVLIFAATLLTLKVSNQWLWSLHSLSLQDAPSPCPQMTLKTSSLMSFVWLVMHLIPLFSQFYLVCFLPLSLWILLVAITWHLTRPYFLNSNLHHTLLIFTHQMVPQYLVII